MFFATTGPDLALQQLINQEWRCRLLDWLMPIASEQALLWVLGLAALVYLVRTRGARQIILFLVILAAVGVADYSTGMIKKNFQRVRPLNSVPGVYFREDGQWRRLPRNFVQTKKTGKSYVSAHAANSMVVAALAMLFWPRTRPWLFILPLLSGYSRVYLGKHFPTDVLAGWLYGLVVAMAFYLAFKALGGPMWVEGPRPPDREATG